MDAKTLGERLRQAGDGAAVLLYIDRTAPPRDGWRGGTVSGYFAVREIWTSRERDVILTAGEERD